MKRKHLQWKTLGVLVVVLLFAAGIHVFYFLPSTCEPDAVKNAATILLTQMTHFDDVYVSAANGTRDSVDYPVNEMQQTLMDTQQIEVPACMQTAQNELVSYMRDVVRAFQAFQTGEPDAAVQALLDTAYAHVRVFLAEVRTVEACAPFCLPFK